MQVSFGSMIYECNGLRRTKKQQVVENKIDKLFEETDKFDLVDDWDNYKPISLSDYVKQNSGADVFVRHKENGNIEIRLKEGLDSSLLETDKLDKDNKPIFVNLDLKKPLSVISRQLNKFARKCIEYAGNYENMVVEKDDPEDSLRKYQALQALWEEERFISEFGTDRYN